VAFGSGVAELVLVRRVVGCGGTQPQQQRTVESGRKDICKVKNDSNRPSKLWSQRSRDHEVSPTPSHNTVGRDGCHRERREEHDGVRENQQHQRQDQAHLSKDVPDVESREHGSAAKGMCHDDQ
jgi:hypothetical protein